VGGKRTSGYGAKIKDCVEKLARSAAGGNILNSTGVATQDVEKRNGGLSRARWSLRFPLARQGLRLGDLAGCHLARN
jgi:hypothetical protein